MIEEAFPTFDRDALAVLKARDVPRVRAADYFSKRVDSSAEADQELAAWDAYLEQFAKLTDGQCLCCGIQLSCSFNLFGGFEWGLEYGEGHCVHCRYPMRGHHRVDGLGTIRNLFLPYHPSGLSFEPKEEP